MDAWILTQCQKVYSHKIATCLVIGLLIVPVGLLTKNYWINFFGGPYPIEESELCGLKGSEPIEHYFVRVTGSEVADTGLREFENVRRGEETDRRLLRNEGWGAFTIGEGFILALADD